MPPDSDESLLTTTRLPIDAAGNTYQHAGDERRAHEVEVKEVEHFISVSMLMIYPVRQAVCHDVHGAPVGLGDGRFVKHTVGMEKQLPVYARN